MIVLGFVISWNKPQYVWDDQIFSLTIKNGLTLKSFPENQFHTKNSWIRHNSSKCFELTK